MKTTLIVYHVKTPSTICPDGFGAATLFWQKYGEEAEYMPVMYHQVVPIERFVGRDVFFLDFSFDVEVMDEIAKVAHTLVVMDHHMPKAHTFSGRNYATFSATESGVIMAWRYLHGNLPIPSMLEILDDADRHVNITPNLAEFMSALAVEEQSFSNWSHLMATLQRGTEAFNAFITKGKILDQYDVTRVNLLAKDAFPITLCGIKGLAVNSNKFYSHLAGIKLARHSGTFGAVFYLRPDGKVEVSLRRLDPDIDVEKIAATFGGGGHQGAAGFSIPLERFYGLLHYGYDWYARIEAAVVSFQYVLDNYKYYSLDELRGEFLTHLQSKLGSFADDLSFDLTESAGYPRLWPHILATVARFFMFPETLEKPTWYSRFFPYVKKRHVGFDDSAIRQVLESGAPSDSTGILDQLMRTVNVEDKLSLVSSTYYVHIKVQVPDNDKFVLHTFEVKK